MSHEPHPQESSDVLGDVDDFDPMEVYIVDDFMEENDIFDEFITKIGEELKAEIEGESSGCTRHCRRQSEPRRYIPRNRRAGHDDLVANYFYVNRIYTNEVFRRRFRMNKPLFLCIVHTFREWSPYFTQRVEAIGRDGHSPLQKCIVAIKMLDYGTSTDQLDEVLNIAQSTCLEILENLMKG